MAEGQRLDVPRGRTRTLASFFRLNNDAVGRFAEGIARFLGTGRFLAVQTIIVILWITINGQADRDRVQAEEDRARAASTRADTEYLARELAALRVAIGELATRDFIRGELNRLTEDDEDVEKREKKAKKRRDTVA